MADLSGIVIGLVVHVTCFMVVSLAERSLWRMDIKQETVREESGWKEVTCRRRRNALLSIAARAVIGHGRSCVSVRTRDELSEQAPTKQYSSTAAWINQGICWLMLTRRL